LARDLCNPENESILSELLGELFVDAIPVRLKPAPKEAQAGPPPEVAKASDLAEHPAVREALEVFEASVVQLNPSSEK
jgi:DNA polymerase-3 subunit gamma/tau